MEARTHSLHDGVARALAVVRAQFGTNGGPSPLPAIAVAYSGGLDSTVLLHLMRHYADEHQIALRAFHVHHGLSADADLWLGHCRNTCVALGIAFDERRVKLESDDGNSIEEAARDARYAALGAMCREHGVNLLLTAHHVDDQAETVLLQMLRGSGLVGMAGMDGANRAPGLLGSDAIVIARPLLGVLRSELENFARRHGIVNIEDESNTDPRFARNALRHRVMPAMEANFPGFQQRFARAAQHARAAQGLLVDLAQMDIARCRIDGLPRWRNYHQVGPITCCVTGFRHWVCVCLPPRGCTKCARNCWLRRLMPNSASPIPTAASGVIAIVSSSRHQTMANPPKQLLSHLPGTVKHRCLFRVLAARSILTPRQLA